MNVEMPPARYPLPEATRLILGDNHGLADPQRWVAIRLRRGEFTGQKIGRNWFMRAGDVEAALESMNSTPAPEPEPAAEPKPGPVSVMDGLSARSRRRLTHHRR